MRAKTSMTEGPAIHPNWATLQARDKTPAPITAVIICAVAVHNVPVHSIQNEKDWDFLCQTRGIFCIHGRIRKQRYGIPVRGYCISFGRWCLLISLFLIRGTSKSVISWLFILSSQGDLLIFIFRCANYYFLTWISQWSPQLWRNVIIFTKLNGWMYGRILMPLD